jgi:hypothetical protein
MDDLPRVTPFHSTGRHAHAEVGACARMAEDADRYESLMIR